MIIPITLFKIMVWGSIIVSGILMVSIFIYFLYELKQNEIW